MLQWLKVQYRGRRSDNDHMGFTRAIACGWIDGSSPGQYVTGKSALSGGSKADLVDGRRHAPMML